MDGISGHTLMGSIYLVGRLRRTSLRQGNCVSSAPMMLAALHLPPPIVVKLDVRALTACESTFSPLRPPAIPLAVRSPYLSTWLQVGSDHGNGGYLAGQWPTFWKVDGESYIWMGKPDGISKYVNQTAFSYTSTKSVFQMDICNAVGMNITFLSPVTPNDMLRSSLPYSYLDVQVFSLDGHNHNISVYTDISPGDRSSKAIWDYGGIDDARIVPNASAMASAAAQSAIKTTYAASSIVSSKAATNKRNQVFDGTVLDLSPLKYGDGSGIKQIRSESEDSSAVAYHKLWLNNQVPFSETKKQAVCKASIDSTVSDVLQDWGYLYYATKNDTCLTYRQASDVLTRQQFIDDGCLSNTVNTKARADANISTVFAFAVDLGQVNAPKNALFQLSLHQHDAVQFLGDHGVQTVPSLWTSYFDSDKDAISFFYNDYETSKALSEELDEQISKDSLADAGEDYLAITSLATRQAFGSIVWTNTPSQPWIFMKEISSNGNMNTVDGKIASEERSRQH
ncbi:hypothetical protein MRB53_037778 [Persea americana]|nr:hypothetical protein MRB53_037778 [Persea americana]